jgi:hypothetical protein
MHVVETLPIDQADSVIAAGESFAFLGFVLEDTPVEVVGHADVERAAGAALHHVHVGVIFAAHERSNKLSSREQHQLREAELGAESRDPVFCALNCALLMGDASVMDVTFRVGAWGTQGPSTSLGMTIMGGTTVFGNSIAMENPDSLSFQVTTGHPEPDNSLPPPAKRVTIAPNAVDLKRIISTFTYRIEAKPQGGFIAHANDPSLPPLEAPTREELQQKIQANIGAALAKEFSGLNLPGNLLSGKELKFDFHIEAKPGGGFSLHSHDPNATTIEGVSHEEIEYPFAEKLAGVVGKYLLPELSQALAKQGGSGDIVDRKVSFTAKSGFQKPSFGNAQNFQPSGAGQSPNSAPNSAASSGSVVDAGDSSPITFEKSKSWPILRFLLTLLVVAVLMYFFLHR